MNNNPPVQSESLRTVASQEARMEHVLDALRLGQKTMAEELFARVSKRLLVEEIERHRQGSLVGFPSVKRVLDRDFALVDSSFVFVLDHRLVCALDAKNLAGQLEVAARGIGDRIGLSFTGAERGILLDNFVTSMDDFGSGLWSFKWKQKYAT